MGNTIVNDIVGEAVSQPTSEEQQREERRQEAAAEKQKERLDYALMCIRDNGGSISGKQLTEILIKKFELKRPTVASLISQWVKDTSVIEVNGMIHASDETALAF